MSLSNQELKNLRLNLLAKGRAKSNTPEARAKAQQTVYRRWWVRALKEKGMEALSNLTGFTGGEILSLTKGQTFLPKAEQQRMVKVTGVSVRSWKNMNTSVQVKEAKVSATKNGVTNTCPPASDAGNTLRREVANLVLGNKVPLQAGAVARHFGLPYGAIVSLLSALAREKVLEKTKEGFRKPEPKVVEPPRTPAGLSMVDVMAELKALRTQNDTILARLDSLTAAFK